MWKGQCWRLCSETKTKGPWGWPQLWEPGRLEPEDKFPVEFGGRRALSPETLAIVTNVTNDKSLSWLTTHLQFDFKDWWDLRGRRNENEEMGVFNLNYWDNKSKCQETLKNGVSV